MKLASVVPPACASCYLQRLEEPHVDFEVAYDGPVLPPTDGGVRYTVDDLVLCRKCLSDAAALVGLGDVEAANAKAAAAMAACERQAAEAAEALDTLDAVRAAFQALDLEMPEPRSASKPRTRRVRKEGQ